MILKKDFRKIVNHCKMFQEMTNIFEKNQA